MLLVNQVSVITRSGLPVGAGVTADVIVTVTELVVLEPSLAAVRVYVVVVFGDTGVVPLGATLPTAGSTVTVVAPETFQLKVAV